MFYLLSVFRYVCCTDINDHCLTKRTSCHTQVCALFCQVSAWLTRERCGELVWWNCRDSGDTFPFGSGAVDQRLLSSTCHSLLHSELMYTLGKNQACCGRDHLFELQAAVEWKAVVSRGADERTLMNSTAILLATCESLTSRNLVDQGMALTTQQGTEPQQRERADGVRSFCRTLAETTSARAKWLTGTEWSQLEAFVNALARQRTSNQNLEDKWMKWVKLVRSVGGYDICAQHAAANVAQDCVPGLLEVRCRECLTSVISK